MNKQFQFIVIVASHIDIDYDVHALLVGRNWPFSTHIIFTIRRLCVVFAKELFFMLRKFNEVFLSCQQMTILNFDLGTMFMDFMEEKITKLLSSLDDAVTEHKALSL